MARKKVKTKDLKKQRWAAIVAGILAFGMLASVVGVYLSQAAGGRGPLLPDQPADPQPEDYLSYYESEVERLEEYLEEQDPSPAVLLELAENYRYLTFIQQAFFNNEEAISGYRDRMVFIYRTLVELEPDDPGYRLEYLRVLLEEDGYDRQVAEEIAVLREMLAEEPDPLVHLSLIGLLQNAGKEDMYQEELEELRGYLEEKLTAGTADNEERFYYAVLLGEYLDDPAAAGEILDHVLEEENPDSWIYREAENYRSYLLPDND